MKNDAGGEAAQEPGVWLAIDTSTAMGSVALAGPGIFLELTLRILDTRSERLLPALDRALTTTDTRPDQVQGIVVGSGPGSFTGLRIAASFARGWTAARDIQMFAYSSLLAVAAGSGRDGPVCPMFDARRGTVYAACYEFASGRVRETIEPVAQPVERLLSDLVDRGLNPVFTGEGAAIHEAAIRKTLPEAQVLPEHLRYPRAASLIWLRECDPDSGRVADPATWDPLYVREWRMTRS